MDAAEPRARIPRPSVFVQDVTGKTFGVIVPSQQSGWTVDARMTEKAVSAAGLLRLCDVTRDFVDEAVKSFRHFPQVAADPLQLFDRHVQVAGSQLSGTITALRGTCRLSWKGETFLVRNLAEVTLTVPFSPPSAPFPTPGGAFAGRLVIGINYDETRLEGVEEAIGLMVAVEGRRGLIVPLRDFLVAREVRLYVPQGRAITTNAQSLKIRDLVLRVAEPGFVDPKSAETFKKQVLAQ